MTITATTATAAGWSAADFRVFDLAGVACTATQDPLGYQPLSTGPLTAGQRSEGILSHRIPREVHEFVVVFYPRPELPGAIWR